MNNSFSFIYFSNDDFTLLDDIVIDEENNPTVEQYLRLIPTKENYPFMAYKLGEIKIA